MLACTTRRVRRRVRHDDYDIDEEYDGGDGDENDDEMVTVQHQHVKQADKRSDASTVTCNQWLRAWVLHEGSLASAKSTRTTPTVTGTTEPVVFSCAIVLFTARQHDTSENDCATIIYNCGSGRCFRELRVTPHAYVPLTRTDRQKTKFRANGSG